MSKKATHADAHLILKLYDLRREAEMRKAREWWTVKFWPKSADDFLKTSGAMDTPESGWLRQVGSYWSLASSFVLNGTLNEELFLQPSFSGEMFIIFAKVHPFLKDLRAKSGDPQMFRNLEDVITGSKWGRNRLQFMLKRVETMRERMAPKTKN
jgi:hypothetical protein